MKNTSLAVVTNFLAAVQKLDFDTVAGLLHPNVKWEQPGNNRFSGIKNSVEDVLAMASGMFAISEQTFALDAVHSYAVNGDDVAATLTWKANREGQQLNVQNIDVYTVAEGKITAVKIFTADEQQENNFWGN
ncbi:nuclear transport factor 2 family protein [Chitinophaga sp. Cy-1792]|uniref:nuclear transport factor 2 family protein n=1 Tax=Chitinophaga sp. Cy-1792 TaxID=2608339 RepID=UPI001421F3F4|nr:nuclear transport factor 2 family protein [Chitinophaga sp. Cy-1792]NIG53244.1 nuclear transport factor 2 family protein [Chitinophaga sp. Cy-1792]